MTSTFVQASSPALDNTFVLHARPLRDGAILHETSRFRDHKWELFSATFQKHQRRLSLDFDTLPARYRPVAKELCYAMLSGQLPHGESRPRPETILSMFSCLRKFLAWLDDRPGAGANGPALVDLVGDDLSAYQRHLKTAVPHPPTRERHRAVVRLFWRYRTVLTADHLPFDPHHVDGWGEESKKHRSPENATDRIPEAVHGPLLAWAMRFLDDFAEDILAADRTWRHQRDPARHATLSTRHATAGKVTRHLDSYRARQRPLPGYQGQINYSHLADEIGCHRTAYTRRRAEIEELAAVVGLSPCSYFDIPITGTLDDEPWIDGIVADHTAANGLGRLARMLHVAAYTVIAFLSGMRDSEIKHLRRGCLRVQRDDQDRPYRWKIASLAFKGEDDPRGVEATWVVGAPAGRAVQILERLQPAGVDLLFNALDHGPSNGTKTRSAADTCTLTSGTTNSQLNQFVQWVNDYCAAHDRSDGIPLVAGKVWRLFNRQFRRTLAWFIARRPGGAIAGAIAFRHLSVQMFEGYAGTSDSGFRAEVESEQALARGEHLLAMVDQHEHKSLCGPAADEAALRLENFSDRTRFQGMVATDQRRLDKIMRRHDPAIYPGKYVTCVHKNATALCQQRPDSRGQTRPDQASCKPLACRNVALTTDNIDNLRQEAHRIDRELAARPSPPPLLERQLRDRQSDLIAFLARHSQQENQ